MDRSAAWTTFRKQANGINLHSITIMNIFEKLAEKKDPVDFTTQQIKNETEPPFEDNILANLNLTNVNPEPVSTKNKDHGKVKQAADKPTVNFNLESGIRAQLKFMHLHTMVDPLHRYLDDLIEGIEKEYDTLLESIAYHHGRDAIVAGEGYEMRRVDDSDILGEVEKMYKLYINNFVACCEGYSQLGNVLDNLRTVFDQAGYRLQLTKHLDNSVAERSDNRDENEVGKDDDDPEKEASLKLTSFRGLNFTA